MSDSERITVIVPTDLAASVRSAVEAGDYPSATDVIRVALLEWELKRNLQSEEMADLKASIGLGVDDARAGRIKDFDPARIAELGRRLSADRSSSG